MTTIPQAFLLPLWLQLCSPFADFSSEAVLPLNVRIPRGRIIVFPFILFRCPLLGSCCKYYLCCFRLGARSCLILCNLMDCSPPGTSHHGISQMRILEWVAISFSRDLPHPGIELSSLESPALASGFFTTSTTWEE